MNISIEYAGQVPYADFWTAIDQEHFCCDPKDLADVMVDLITGMPLSDEKQWEANSYLRVEFALLKTVLDNHLAFVYSKGASGCPIRRHCDSCKRDVYLHYDDRYRLFDPSYIRHREGGGWHVRHDSPPPLHELCIRPRPRGT